MSPELVSCLCEMNALVAEMESMKVENSIRLSNGYTVAHDDQAFLHLSIELRVLASQVRGLSE